MPNDINIDKVSGLSPIRAIGHNDIKKSSDETTKPIEANTAINDDKLELSNRGTEVGKYVEQLKELPELREEKISHLREQISSGSYNPSSEAIADAILKDEKI